MANKEYKVSAIVDKSKLQASAKTALESQTIKVNVDVRGVSDLKVASTETKRFYDNIGNARTEINSFNKDGVLLGSTIKNTSKEVKNTSNEVKTLGADFLDTMGKVAKFGAITAVIGTFTSAISKAVTGTKELDGSLIELQKVSDEARNSLKATTEQAFELGETLSTSATNVTDAVTEFSKSGYSLQESFDLAESALVFQTIADGAISASDSATLLIQTMKAYNMTASESERIISAINEVSNNYAVSSTDLSGAIGKIASTARLAGVEFENLLGLIVSSNEIVQNAGKVATGYKSILTNLMTKDLEKQFNEFGLTMRDQVTGALKDGYTILQELSVKYREIGEVWDDDTESMVSLNDSMNALLEDIGGKYNINTLTAGLQNFDQAVKSTESALNSAGSASKEFETAMSGLDKKIEGLEGQFLQLVWGDGGLNELLKLFVDTGTAVLKFANSDIGGLIIQAVALTTTLSLLNKGVKALHLSMATGKGIGIFLSMIQQLITGSVTLTGAITTLISVANPLLLLVSAVAIGISAVVAITKKANREFSDSIDAMQEMSNEYTSTISNVKSLSQQLEELREKIKGVEDGSLKLVDENDLKIMKEQEASLERQLKIQQQMANIEKLELEQSAVDTLSTKNVSAVQRTSYSSTRTTAEEEIDRIITKYNELKASKKSMEEYLSTTNLDTKKYEEFKKKLEEVESEMETLRVKGNELSDTLFDVSENLFSEKYDELKETLRGFIDGWLEATDSSVEFEDAIEEVVETNTRAKVSIEEMTEAYSQSISNLGDMKSAFETLSDAVEEYNNSGELSADTVLKLLELDEEYLSLLQDENGQLSINEDAMNNLAKAKIDSAKADAINTTYANLLAYANGELSDKFLEVGESATIVSPKILQAGIDANKSGDSAKSGADGWTEFWSALTNSAGVSDEDSRRSNFIKEQEEALKQNLALLDNLGDSLGDYAKGQDNVTSSIENQKSALNELKSQYDTVISYVTKQIGKQIDALEKARDAQIEVIEAQIEAIEKAKDAEVSALEAMYEALEKAQEKEIKTLNERLSVVKEAHEEEIELLNGQLDSLKTLKDARDKYYSEQISKLKEEQSLRKSYWDEQIDALKESNDELEKQIKLSQLLSDLEEAKNRKVKIYKEGEGFTYGQDENAISQAQEALDTFNREQEYNASIKALEENRDKEQEIYNQKIANLESLQKRESESYQTRIDNLKSFIERQKASQEEEEKILEDYIKKREESNEAQLESLKSQIEYTKKSYDSQISILKQQVSDIKAQYQKQIDNLNEYKDNFVSMTEEYSEQQDKLLAEQLLGMKLEGNTWASRLSNAKKFVGDYNSVLSQLNTLNSSSGGSSVKVSATSSVSKYATGTSGVESDEVAFVGDAPNTEMVIGSKMNKSMGTLMNLKEGTGVVNAKATKTLAGFFNNISDKMSGSQTQSMANNSKSVNNEFNVNVSVQDGAGFVDYMKDFKTRMTQEAFAY